MTFNKANLKDLIAATGLVILLKFDQHHRFFSPCDLEIWWMTSTNNRAPLHYYIKLSALLQSHRWIQTVRKRSIQVKISNFLSHVTLKLDGWPWKTIGHVCYATSSFVHHFVAIGKFKLELQSGNAQFESKSSVTLKFDGWPWNTIGLCFFKLCASFHNHWWIQTGVTVRQRRIWVKIDDFFSCVTSKIDLWPWKAIGHLFYATSSFAHHLLVIGEFKLELQSRNAQSGSNSTLFWAVWPWHLTDDLEQGKSDGFDSGDQPSNLTQIGFTSSIF